MSSLFEPIGKSYDALYDMLGTLRVEQPVHYWAEQDCHIVSRYDDIMTVLRDAEHYTTNGNLNVMNGAYCPEAMDILRKGIDWTKTPQINDLEGVEHARVRGVMQKILTPHRFRKMEPMVRGAVTRLIDGFVANGQCDFVGQFSYPLPVLVIFDVIGFRAEEEDMEKLQQWSDDYFKLWLAPLTPEEQVRCANHAIEFQNYIKGKLAERRIDPRDDLVTEFVRELDSGDARLSEDEVIIMFPMNLIGAGHETTKSALSNALYQLLREPARWQAIVDDPSTIPAVVEECLRLDSSVLAWYRSVARDVELGGVSLKKGDRLVLALGSGNHDETKFDNAESFCPGRRRQVNHLSFSADRHFCLGAPLARLEMKVAIDELSRRLPGLRLAPDAEIIYEPSVATRVIHELRLQWDADAALAGVAELAESPV